MFAPPWMLRSSPSDAGTREVVLTMLHESSVGALRAQASGGCNGSTSFKPSTKSRSAIPNIAFHMSKPLGTASATPWNPKRDTPTTDRQRMDTPAKQTEQAAGRARSDQENESPG